MRSYVTLSLHPLSEGLLALIKKMRVVGYTWGESV